MKADVYTGFLTDKVTVYSTDKKVKPQRVSGAKIRKKIPVLLASMMMALPISCQAVQERSGDKEEVKTETKAFSAEKEFLSDAEIDSILLNPSPAVLKDVNYNHLPENQENFWEIVRNGVAKTNELQYSSSLSAAQKAEYRIMARKMLAQISHNAGDMQQVDLRDYNNLKSFLYFEKVVKYGNKYWNVLGKSEGTIDERTELFGRYYQDLETLKQNVDQSQGVQKFAKALYGCNDRFILSYKDSIQANRISREMLKGWLSKQKVTDNNLWYFANTDDYDYCNVLAVYNSRGYPLRAVLGVDPKGDLGNGFYSPVGSVLIHELQHLMQKKPASKEQPEDNQKNASEVKVKRSYYDDFVMELGPTLYSLAIEDKIYKEIHGIAADKVMKYGSIDLGTHRVSLGETAVWFGKMMDKYPELSVDKLLSKPEVLNHLNALGNNSKTFVMTNHHSR